MMIEPVGKKRYQIYSTTNFRDYYFCGESEDSLDAAETAALKKSINPDLNYFILDVINKNFIK